MTFRNKQEPEIQPRQPRIKDLQRQVIAFEEANAALDERYRKFMVSERRNGFKYLHHLQAAFADQA